MTSSPQPASVRIAQSTIAVLGVPLGARRGAQLDALWVAPWVAPWVVPSAVTELSALLTQGRRLLPALFLSVTTFAAAEGHRWAVLTAIACGLLVAAAEPRRVTIVPAVLAACLVAWLGAIALPVLALVALWSTLGATGALICAAAVLLAAEWLPKAVLVLATSMPSVATALPTIGMPVFAALGLVAAIGTKARTVALARTLGFGVVLGAVIWGLCEARWVGPDVLSAPALRLALTFGFVVLCTSTAGSPRDVCQAFPSVLLMSLLVSASLAAAIASQRSSATSVVFDEAHGDWASVSLPLEPDDFGRSTTYSWRALANSLEGAGVRVRRATNAQKFEPPSDDALYVLKMPLKTIEPGFAQGLLDWVSDGGRLLLVADHTDLFDTAQNLNTFLAALGVRISPTAVFDRHGQPPVMPRAHWRGLSWLHPSHDHRYLTGSSFEALPWSALPVQTYGMTFAEQAVYFKANRFGYFQPDLAHPFGNCAFRRT